MSATSEAWGWIRPHHVPAAIWAAGSKVKVRGVTCVVLGQHSEYTVIVRMMNTPTLVPTSALEVPPLPDAAGDAAGAAGTSHSPAADSPEVAGPPEPGDAAAAPQQLKLF